jgi:hypothetical protein
MAQMQATMERQAALIERLMTEPPRRGPGRPPKTTDE